jgi:hypothetical protein
MHVPYDGWCLEHISYWHSTTLNVYSYKHM